jgi:cytochrome c2
MPASLRWLMFLVGLAVAAALVSGGGLYWETWKKTQKTAETLAGGHADAGRAAIARYGCGACHAIPGIHEANGTVGPPLNGIAVRAHIAGVLPNEPGQMVRWLRQPQAIVPGNGMPDLGVTERDARDMAAYLYTLKS